MINARTSEQRLEKIPAAVAGDKNTAMPFHKTTQQCKHSQVHLIILYFHALVNRKFQKIGFFS
jgi:hypothetical protein